MFHTRFFVSVGVILDKFRKHRFVILFAFALIHGITTLCIPFLKYLGLYYFNGVISGFVSAGLATGGNALCMDTWSKDEVGPLMNMIHFSFAIGIFVGPLIAMPFLGEKIESSTNVMSNSSIINRFENEDSGTQIKTLFALVGGIAILCSFGYLFMALKAKSINEPNTKSEDKEEDELEEKYHYKHWLFIMLMGLFFFFYVASEAVYFHYLAVFPVVSSLNLDKLEGAKVSAIFSSCFAISRLIGVFTAMKMKPIHILVLNFGIALTSVFILMLFADQYEIVLKIMIGTLAFGLAPLYATGTYVIYSFQKSLLFHQIIFFNHHYQHILGQEAV